jgi:hypothetical protein
MADRPRARRGDGVTMAPGTSPGKALGLLAAAVVLACLALLVLCGWPVPPQRPPPPEPSRAATPSPPTTPAVAAEPEPPPSAERDEASAPPPEPQGPDAEAPPPTLPSGIGLYPPPGTDPIKIGLVVPDDFELPEGFLRHYQVTDDGQELPPILLFHPVYELVGTDGRPLPLPEDRVVPPELAPPGMPQEWLVVPEPREEEGR